MLLSNRPRDKVKVNTNTNTTKAPRPRRHIHRPSYAETVDLTMPVNAANLCQSVARILTALLAAGTAYSVYASEIQWGGYHSTVSVLYYLSLAAAGWNIVVPVSVLSLAPSKPEDDDGRGRQNQKPRLAGNDPLVLAAGDSASGSELRVDRDEDQTNETSWFLALPSLIDKVLPSATALTLVVNWAIFWGRRSRSLQPPTQTLVVILITLELLLAGVCTTTNRRARNRRWRSDQQQQQQPIFGTSSAALNTC
ncbi:hypothetical protein F5Y16DRAFT_402647 [Xylariaceae sp. FL0255]|nr:hypothetical protein F5Y16DRAFT_402647 [Xylariaceae sp. FL0255]